MKVLVVSYTKRLPHNVLDTRLVKSLLTLGLDVVVWGHDRYKNIVSEIRNIGGRVAPVIDSPPYEEKFDLIFFVTSYLPSPLIVVDWLKVPIVYFGVDAWGKSDRWETMKYFVSSLGELYKKGFPLEFWAVSEGVAQDIKDLVQSDVPVTVIKGRVPDEVFLVPEELCVSPTRPRRNIILWIGHNMKDRTYKLVWTTILSQFSDRFLTIVDDDPYIPSADRRVVPYINLNHLSSLRLIYQSEVVVAPYTHGHYHIYQNPIKYWECLSLNTPFVVTNVEMLKGDSKCLCLMTENEETATQFVVSSIKKILTKEVNPPFTDPQTLHKWRRENWFTRLVALNIKGVLEKWNLEIPSQLSRFLDTTTE